MEKMIYRSAGKLMITGEYLVLEGAEALALPTRPGQSLVLTEITGKPQLAWKTYVEKEFWFEANFSIPDLAIGNTNDFPIAQSLRDLILAARELQPNFLTGEVKTEAVSNIEFNINWGLGSSSSLLVNVARWAGVDPYRLHSKVSAGSGYDVAVAQKGVPIVYSIAEGKPEVREVEFDPPFTENLYFGWLGRKSRSVEAVADFREKEADVRKEVEEITSITHKILKSNNIVDFTRLINQHEEILSRVLKVKPLKKSRFSDFNGSVKSLGAWGGDFALFASDYPREYVSSYLKRKDIKSWFSYDDLIAKPNINSLV